MKQANLLLTVFYAIAFLITMVIFVAVLATTSTIDINDQVLNMVLVTGLTVLSTLIFFFGNTSRLKKLKDLLDGKYNESSAGHIPKLIAYPFTVAPLIVLIELLSMIIYLIAGNFTNIIVIFNRPGGLLLSLLFTFIISVLSYVYAFKIVTNLYVTRSIRKLNIVEMKSLYIPMRYKLIGVFSLITISAFFVILYANYNSALTHINANLYSNTMNTLSYLDDVLNNNPNADGMLRNLADTFQGKYRFYLYKPADKSITNYSDVPLGKDLIKQLQSKTIVTGSAGSQILFSPHSTVSISGSTYRLVIGTDKLFYRKQVNSFIYNLLLSGILMLIVILITTLLISDYIASLEKNLTEYSLKLSKKELVDLPEIVSTDELGMVLVDLRELVINFRGSKYRTAGNVSEMNTVIRSTFDFISRVKSSITEQSKSTDDLLGTINSIQDVSDQIMNVSAPFNDKVLSSIGNIVSAVQKNKEISEYIQNVSLWLSRSSKQITNHIKSHEAIRDNIVRLKSIIAAITSTAGSLSDNTMKTNGLLEQCSVSINAIRKLNAKGTEFTRDIDALFAEAQNIIDGVLSLLSTFLSHIQQADEMFGVINNVAERTNLLSVNAFILASSPQSEGKNFRVVAEEIKRLAERARRGSREISGYITKVRRDIDGIFINIKEVNSFITLSKHSLNSIGSITARTDELLASMARSVSESMQTNKSTGDAGLKQADGSPQAELERLAGDMTSVIDTMWSIHNTFMGLKTTMDALSETSSSHAELLISVNNSIENVKTFLGYINDSLASDIKSQIALSSGSAKGLIDHIKNNEHNITKLESTINNLALELDLLNDAIKLFVV